MAPPPLGVRENLRAFIEQMVQVFFSGLTIGLERTVLPTLGERDFGLTKGSMTALMSFVVAFGITKAVMNLVSGQLSESYGRRRLLIWGWVAALPIPPIILWAPSWGWIVAANLFLGVNQGFCWSMTVTAKMDIVRANQRGLATGLNEFAGYGGVALAGLATGYLATGFDPRTSLVLFGGAVILLGLFTALVAFTETLPIARATARALDEAAGNGAAGLAAQPSLAMFAAGPGRPGLGPALAYVSWHNAALRALAQAGSIEKFVDAAIWVLVPAYLVSRGLGLIEIGWITATYGLVWGLGQLVTGALSDRIGRKPLILGGFLACAGGMLAFPWLPGPLAWGLAAGVTGLGMAALYPNLIAAMGDLSHPAWRGPALGVYRFWRDLGYAFGAMAMGLLADWAGAMDVAFSFTGAAMLVSAVWLALSYPESHPPRRR